MWVNREYYESVINKLKYEEDKYTDCAIDFDEFNVVAISHNDDYKTTSILYKNENGAICEIFVYINKITHNLLCNDFKQWLKKKKS